MKIGITIGDINGVGPEIIIKALKNNTILQHITPVIYGSSKVLSYHKNIVKNVKLHFNHINDSSKIANKKINVVNCWNDTVNINLGKVDVEGGKCAKLALEHAVKDLKSKKIDALITAPINKEAMKLAEFGYPGHTEFLDANLNGKSMMLMTNGELKVALVTNHLPLEQVAKKITKELILTKIETLKNTLISDFGIEKPTIAILGLNPHAGDGGAIGKEDENIIRPAIIEAKKKGLLVYGPYAADGYFGSSNHQKFDATLAMYHDQGLIPFKVLSFGNGTNFTAGLEGIRTSPDHGTAFDIAGKNKADYHSMLNAIYTAVDIAKNRKDFFDSRANKLNVKIRPSDTQEEEVETK